MPGRLTLPARLRLRRKRDFDAAYARGRRVGDGFFAVTASMNDTGAPRLGLAVAVRIAGGAVGRNRIRRIIRESFRLHQRELPAVDLVVSARPRRARPQEGSCTRVWRRCGRKSVSSALPRRIPDPYLSVDAQPALGPACRFYPSCSQYARQSILRFGLLRGGWLALKRLGRCHPWHPGGFDPVPSAAAAPVARITPMSNNFLPNSPRVYLWVALGLLMFLNVEYWLQDYAPTPVPEATPVAGSTTVPAANDLTQRLPAGAQSPAGASPAPAVTPAAAPAAAAPAETAAAAPVVHVRTDVYDIDISTRGGTLARVDLPAYPQVKGEATPVRLENHDSPQTLYVLQSGLTGPAGGAYPDSVRALYERKRRLPHGRQRRAARAAHLERRTASPSPRPSSSTAASYRDRRQYDVHNERQRAVASCAVCADPAQRSAAPSAPISTSRAMRSTARRSTTATSIRQLDTDRRR